MTLFVSTELSVRDTFEFLCGVRGRNARDGKLKTFDTLTLMGRGDGLSIHTNSGTGYGASPRALRPGGR